MVLKNHFAHRFLTEDSLQWEILKTYFPEEHKYLMVRKDPIDSPQIQKDLKEKITSQFLTMTSLLMSDKIHPEPLKNYYVTNTVLDNLKLLKVKKKGDRFDWSVFNNVDQQKVTFILPNDKLLRMEVLQEHINFCYIEFQKDNRGVLEGKMTWDIFFVNRITGEQSGNFSKDRLEKIDTFIYALLCFVYLSDIEEITLRPGQTEGTKKTGKTLNNTEFPVTIINSRWNVTVTVKGEFGVSGHFAIRWVGKGREIKRVVWIEPFKKKGMVRQSKKQQELN